LVHRERLSRSVVRAAALRQDHRAVASVWTAHAERSASLWLSRGVGRRQRGTRLLSGYGIARRGAHLESAAAGHVLHGSTRSPAALAGRAPASDVRRASLSDGRTGAPQRGRGQNLGYGESAYALLVRRALLERGAPLSQRSSVFDPTLRWQDHHGLLPHKRPGGLSQHDRRRGDLGFAVAGLRGYGKPLRERTLRPQKRHVHRRHSRQKGAVRDRGRGTTTT